MYNLQRWSFTWNYFKENDNGSSKSSISMLLRKYYLSYLKKVCMDSGKPSDITRNN